LALLINVDGVSKQAAQAAVAGDVKPAVVAK